MSNDTKSYFRHSCGARNDDKINDLMASLGRRAKEAYFYYFTLIEFCASSSEDGQTEFTLHEATLRELWRCNVQGVHEMCDKLTSSALLSHTKRAGRVVFSIPNLPKYKGKYKKEDEKKALIKVKESKEKENKLNEKEEVIVVVNDSKTDYTHPLEIDPDKVNQDHISDALNYSVVGKLTEIQEGLNPPKKKCATNVKDHKFKWFMDLFNDHCESHGMVKIKALSDARTKAIEKGIKAIGEDCETWLKVFKVAGTKGFVGKDGKSWTPEFDYIFTKERYIAFSEADPSKKIITTANDVDHLRDLAQANPY